MKQKKKTLKLKKNKKTEIPTDAIISGTVGRDFFLIICFVLFFSLLLFYPGDGSFFKLFAFNKSLSNNQSGQTVQEIITIPYVFNPQITPSITASGAYVIDLTSATPLYSKNKDLKLLPASTVKVITALTGYKKFELDTVLTVKRKITDGQVAGFNVGEKLTFENVLYALLVHSGNDAAYVIADNYPGGYKEFIIAMNKTAEYLHMSSSRFTNPAGFDAQGQYITAFDLSLASRKLLENKELSKIVSTKSITISDIDFTYFHPLNNVNKLLGEIPGLAGLKTGYTEAAKENLVSFYTHKGKKFVIVILKSDDRFEDTKNIINWLNTNIGFKTYSI